MLYWEGLENAQGEEIMAIDYRTFMHEGFSEYTDRKSRFLGEAVRAATPEEAETYIAAVRKRYYDARHHCFAYIAGEPGTPDEVTRAGDDGEPSGTAGRPILEILTGRALHHVLIVVTRYFGGTLLGTGGLVRAYSSAAKAAAENAGFVTVRAGLRLKVTVGYDLIGKMQYLFEKNQITVAGTEYMEKVVFRIVIPAGNEEQTRKLIREATNAAAVCETDGTEMYEEPVKE